MVCRRLIAATTPGLLLTLLAGGCSVESWRNADLQLDVQSALPGEAEQVRICVDGAGVREQAAVEVGRFAVPGVPTDSPAIVTVQVTVARTGGDTGTDTVLVIGQAGPETLEATAPYVATGYTEYTQGEGPSPCEVTGSFAGDEEESWLLAVRFSG